MAWVPDSRTAGYLGPRPAPSPTPLQDVGWDDFLHDLIAGVSGFDLTLVHPRWQPVPPALPNFGTDWMAFGITQTTPDYNPAIVHIDDGGDGYDALQEHELVEILCSFYGPNCSRYASITRRGLYLDQNRAVLRANGVGLVEVTAFTASPELIKQQWLDRIDATIILRREVRYDYSVLSLLRAKGTIVSNPQGSTDSTETDFDTANVVAPSPHTEE